MIKYKDVILSGDSKRDYAIAKFNPQTDIITDKEFMLKLPNIDVIKNQGNLNACAAFAITTGRSIQEYSQSNMWIDFNPFVLYGTRYINHYKGEGMILREALTVINNEGVFFIDDFSEKSEVPELYPLIADFKSTHPDKMSIAQQYKITGYARLNGINEIKSALKLNMPVVCAYELHDNFMRTGEDGVVPPLLDTDTVIGNHAMMIIGWTINNEWLVLNSWSDAYGYKGLYKIPFNYTLVEAWSMSDTIMPSKIKAKKVTLKINSNKINIDGKTSKIDVAPIIKNDVALVPTSLITEFLGASVELIKATKEIVVRSPEANLKLKVGSNFFSRNNIIKTIPLAPCTIDDVSFVPIKVVAESLNCDVSWVSDTKEIIILAK